MTATRKAAILFLLVTASLFCAAPAARAIEPTWEVDFESVFDNREGDSDITPAKTWFFTRLAPEVGLKFSPADRIAAGAVWFQPIGCEWEGHRVSPTLYYRHEGRRWRFSMGMFPRSQLVEEMSGYLWSDSLRYCQRNLRGVLLQYVAPKGFFDFYVDWRGMQTRSRREAFSIVFHGQYAPGAGWLNFGGYLQMNHYALQKDPPADQHIVDNFMVNPYIGADLGRRAAADSLTVRAGLLMTIERNRAEDAGGWHTPAGFYLEAYVQWRRFAVKNTLYTGGALFPSYNAPGATFADNKAPHATAEDIAANPVIYTPLGPGLYTGEPFYQKKFFDRLDLYARILQTRYVDLTASLDFCFSPSSFIFYQKLTLQVHLP